MPITTRLLYLIPLLAAFASKVGAMDFHPHLTEGGVSVVIASGDIVDGDTDKLERLLDQGKVESRIIMLDSPGGDLLEAMSLGRSLRYFGFTTFLHQEAECLSACAYAFLGGEYRVALPGAAIGVHQFSGGLDDMKDQSYTQSISGFVIGYLNDMGINPKVAEKAMMTPPDRMHVFSEEEVAKFGILTEPGQRTFSRREAASAGLSEAEWLRRRALYLQSPSVPTCYESDDRTQRALCLFIARQIHGIKR